MSMTQERVSQTPPTTCAYGVSDLQHLPFDLSCVYVVWSQTGYALYIGQTSRPRARFREHLRTSDLWNKDIGMVQVFPTDDRLVLEAQLIIRLRPTCNLSGFQNLPDGVEDDLSLFEHLTTEAALGLQAWLAS